MNVEVKTSAEGAGKRLDMSEIREPLYYAKASVETMMRKFQAADLPPKGRFHYHQGVFLSGVYKTYKFCGDERYFNYVKDWVDSCMDEEGNLKDCHTDQLDDMQPGILLYPLLERTGEERYRKVLEFLMANIREYPCNELGGFWHKHYCAHQMWLDGLYMGGPIIAEYAAKFDAPEFFDVLTKQALLMEEKTKDSETGLWFHAWDCIKAQPWADPQTGRAPEFWGRSIGWVPVAILDDLDFLPEDHPKYQEMRRLVKELLEAVAKFQSEDGRWYQVVNKGHLEDNWLENSCSSLYVAAICKAVRKGILPAEYLKVAKKGYEGVIRSLEWDGDNLLVGNVCIGTGVGNYDFYIHRPVSVNDLHGVGAFLIMCAEVQEMWEVI